MPQDKLCSCVSVPVGCYLYEPLSFWVVHWSLVWHTYRIGHFNCVVDQCTLASLLRPLLGLN